MSTNQTSFQDRLKKIEQKQGSAQPKMPAPDGVAVAGGPGMPEFGQGPKKESAIGTGSLMIVGGLVGLLALGAVLARDIFSSPDDITATVMAGGAEREVSLLGKLLGGSFDPQSVRAQLPIYHLPEAPDGWIRATRKDVRKTFALDKLREQWPEPTGSTYVTLDENPGFASLSRFVRMSQVKTAKTENAAKVEAVAHYLSVDGSHLEVVLKFLPAEENLGPADNAEVWAQRMQQTRVGFGKGAAPSISEFGTRPAVMQGNPNLDPTDTLPQKVDMGVPLTPTVIIRLSGKAAPTEIAKILDDISVPGLLAFAG